MKGRRQVKEGFLNHSTIATWIVYVCYSEGEWARQKIELPVNCYCSCCHAHPFVFFALNSFPVCIKNGPPPKGHPVNVTSCGKHESKWASIPVERFRHLVGSMPRQIQAILIYQNSEDVVNVLYTQCRNAHVQALTYLH